LSNSIPFSIFDHGIDIIGDEWEDVEEDEDDNNNQQVANEKI
jgi:hypothetical protein|tara:strand:- start:354 stop:479 length:126 start_codon:yes stop_codon:yes gene_type:complete